MGNSIEEMLEIVQPDSRAATIGDVLKKSASLLDENLVKEAIRKYNIKPIKEGAYQYHELKKAIISYAEELDCEKKLTAYAGIFKWKVDLNKIKESCTMPVRNIYKLILHTNKYARIKKRGEKHAIEFLFSGLKIKEEYWGEELSIDRRKVFAQIYNELKEIIQNRKDNSLKEIKTLLIDALEKPQSLIKLYCNSEFTDYLQKYVMMKYPKLLSR